MRWQIIHNNNFLQVCFVFVAFTLLVLIGALSVSNIIQRASLSTVTVALDETEKTIQAYLREPRIAFDNIYITVRDMLDRDEPQDSIEQFLTQTVNMILSQDNGIRGFLSAFGYIRGNFISGVEHGLSDDFIPQMQPWYQLAIRNRTAEFTAPYVDPVTGLTIISLTREIYGINGDYYGVLALDIDISWLMDYVESLQFAEGGFGMILNQFLFTLAHPQEEHRNVPLHSLGGGYDDIASLLRTHKNVTGEIIVGADKERIIVFFQQLYNGWFIGVVMPVRSYYADLYQSVFLLIGLGIIFSFSLSYILLRLSKDKKQADEESRHKSSFLAWISHEMRTPLNAIIGITQIELQKNNLNDDYATALEKINNSGSGLLGIINDILDLSKIETGKLELIPSEYDLPELINDTVNVNIVRIGSKPLNLILDIDENLPTKLFGDELRLKQIFNNLLSNAIKYTSEGHVKFIIKQAISSSLNEIVDSPKASTKDVITLKIIVEDTGQGMKLEDKEKLFSEYLRFNTETNRATEGTGIGLNITKSLVEMMDGSIEVESEYNRGSVFSVEIKQKAVKCKKIGAETAQQLSNFSFIGSKHFSQVTFIREEMPYGSVLIVDDVETNLYVAEGLMSPYNLQIETAISGYESLNLITNGKIYDIIFMDHMMPIMDGIETTLKMRDMGYKGVIVALTANALVGNAEMFRKNGFDDFISKPIDMQHLNDILNKYIRDKKNKLTSSPLNKSHSTQPTKKQSINQKLLMVFKRDAEKSIDILNASLENGDIKMFTTTAHGMKSALANIGEIEISSNAAALENAGLKSDMDFISVHAPAFIEALENLIQDLSPSNKPKVDDANIQDDLDFLSEQLLIIKTACEIFDDTAAYKSLDLLKERKWKNITAKNITELYDMLFLQSDFEGVVDRIVLWVEEIKNSDTSTSPPTTPCEVGQIESPPTTVSQVEHIESTASKVEQIESPPTTVSQAEQIAPPPTPSSQVVQIASPPTPTYEVRQTFKKINHFLVINPHSFRKPDSIKQIIKDIENIFSRQKKDYKIYISRFPRDAVAAVHRYILTVPTDEMVRVYAIGGDGILFDCLNGMVKFPNAELTSVPYGNANDFLRAFGEGVHPTFRDFNNLIDAPSQYIDIIDCGSNFAINEVNIGLVGRSLYYANSVLRNPKLKWVSRYTPQVYSISAARAMSNLEIVLQKYNVILDGEDLSGIYADIHVANSPTDGGTYVPSPYAKPNDGVLDIIFLSPFSKLEVLKTITLRNSGQFEKCKRFIHRKGKSLEIKSDDPLSIQMDGEALYTQDIKLNIVPNGVKFFAPEGLSFADYSHRAFKAIQGDNFDKQQ
ncbi:MAG: ATP-binding protein [Candidatus Cloacimonetes bacterium]|nr:ATP-binding protein [Candidatus Cloacimonadota bacterium]